MSLSISEVKAESAGRWSRILTRLAPGLSDAIEAHGHVSCPIHGGVDGLRKFNDFHETGGMVCNTCGAMPDGFAVLQWFNDWDLNQSVNSVGAYIGLSDDADNYADVDVPVRLPKPSDSKNTPSMDVRKGLQNLWKDSLQYKLEGKALLKLYLKKRGIDQSLLPLLLNETTFHPALRYKSEGVDSEHPAMLAIVRDPNGEPVTAHRTWFSVENKLPSAKAKRFYPVIEGMSLLGGAIRLGGLPNCNLLGVAEGIETALAVRQATGQTCWATCTGALLANFVPPKGVNHLVVWADKDREHNGEAAGERNALKLKERLEQEGISVTIMLPAYEIPDNQSSIDWLDVLNMKGDFYYI